jgi:O-antigen/teichoic acid export membrane protein
MAGSGAVQIAAMGFTFLVGIQLARALGVSGYGYYGIAMAIITIATIPSALGMPKLVTREVAAADARGDLDGMVGVLRWADRMSWRISAFVGGGVAVAGLAALIFRSSGLGAALLLGAPMIALLPLANIRAGALRGLHQVVRSQGSTVLFRPMFLSILLFGAALLGWPLNAPIAVALNSVTAAGALMLTSFWLAGLLPKNIERQRSQGRTWLASSIPMALSDAAQTLQLQTAILLMGLLSSTAEVGLLRVAMSTAVISAIPVTVVNAVVLPSFSKLHASGNNKQLQQLVTHSARLQFSGVFLLTLPLLLAAGPLLSIVFGSAFAPAATTLQILAAGQLISAGFGPNAALLNMTGHERRVTRAVLSALLVNVMLLVVLGRSFGGVGAAIAIVAGQTCWNLFLWLDARRLLSVETSLMGARR